MARDRTDERRVRSNDMTTDDIDQQPIRQGDNINERRVETMNGSPVAR